jgi:hypothetical protein
MDEKVMTLMVGLPSLKLETGTFGFVTSFL